MLAKMNYSNRLSKPVYRADQARSAAGSGKSGRVLWRAPETGCNERREHTPTGSWPFPGDIPQHRSVTSLVEFVDLCHGRPIATQPWVTGLQEVEVPGTDDGLRAALHSQFATEVIDVPLHRVHAEDEVMSDLAVGGSFKQQSQDVAFALGQRFRKWIRARRGKREIGDVVLPKGSQEGSNIPRYDAACLSVAQQGPHRRALVDEEAEVALIGGDFRHRIPLVR